MRISPRAFVFGLALTSVFTFATWAKADTFTTIVVYNETDEKVYSVKSDSGNDVRFPIRLATLNDYILQAGWTSKGENRVYLTISDPSVILPPSIGTSSNVPSIPASPLPVFSSGFSYVYGKRQLAFTAPLYSIWFQIDEEKKATIAPDTSKKSLLDLDKGPVIVDQPDGAKNIIFSVKQHGEVLPSQVKLIVYVYEEDKAGNLSLANLASGKAIAFEWLAPPVDWKSDESETVLVKYPGPADSAMQYAGTIIGVYYGNDLQFQSSTSDRILKEYPLPPALTSDQ